MTELRDAAAATWKTLSERAMSICVDQGLKDWTISGTLIPFDDLGAGVRFEAGIEAGVAIASKPIFTYCDVLLIARFEGRRFSVSSIARRYFGPIGDLHPLDEVAVVCLAKLARDASQVFAALAAARERRELAKAMQPGQPGCGCRRL